MLDGCALGVEDIASAARTLRRVVVPESSWEDVARSHDRLQAAATRGRVYGASTGVGANKSFEVRGADRRDLSMRLLRSHCAGAGSVLAEDVVRAAMVIRLNQILAGSSGVGEKLARGLSSAISRRALPEIHSLGALGTADIAQLAELALTLAGERPWARGDSPACGIAESDALPFMSSSAFTLAEAALAVHDCARLLRAAETVAAMSFTALRGDVDAWDPVVHASRPQPGQREAAERLRRLVTDRPRPEGRVQDSFALRVLPVVLGAAERSLGRLREAVELECASASENPLVLESGVRHHGMFHLAEVSGLLDHARSTLVSFFALSSARISVMNDPDSTAERRFLSDGLPGSSGLMIGEYVAGDVLATLRTLASPTTHASISISLGIENHASFATQGARQFRDLVAEARWIVGVEALAALRILRRVPPQELTAELRDMVRELSAAIVDDTSDRPIGRDLAAAVEVLESASS